MKRIFFASVLLFFMCRTLVGAQTTVTYSGPRISLNSRSFTCREIGKLVVSGKIDFQGMAVFGDLVVSLKNTGIATLYRYNGKKLKYLGTFDMDIHSPSNHANVACFGTQFIGGDKVPLLYVSKCNPLFQNGLDKILYVERLHPENLSTQLVQKIAFIDEDKSFLGNFQWAVDKENKFLYAFGNNYQKSGNEHFVLKFPLPVYRDEKDSVVIFTKKDALENYVLDDYYHFDRFLSLQGCSVNNGMMLIPTGGGRPADPSSLYVWDLANRCMKSVLDIRNVTRGEPEDCDLWQDRILLQTQGWLYELSF